jgi:hypothetical protein
LLQFLQQDFALLGRQLAQTRHYLVAVTHPFDTSERSGKQSWFSSCRSMENCCFEHSGLVNTWAAC